MAREHGQFEAAAWRDDEDWRALPMDAQWCYMMLLSQGDFSLAGVLHISRRRWVRYAADLDTARLDAALEVLQAERFVVIDEDAEELLVRSFARRKTQWRNPKRRGGFKSAVEAITSSVIRNALRVEVARVDRDLEGNEISGNRSVNPLDENSLNGLPIDSPNISVNRLADVSRLPSPVSEVDSEDSWLSEREEPKDDPTSRLWIEHVKAYADPLPQDASTRWKVQIQKLVGEGISEARIRRALTKCRVEGKGSGLLPHIVAETTTTSDVTPGSGFWGNRV